MNFHRAFLWFVLAVGLAACSGQAGNSATAPPAMPLTAEATVATPAADAGTEAAAATQVAPPAPASPTAVILTPTTVPATATAVVEPSPTASETPVLVQASPTAAATLPPTATFTATATWPPTATPTATATLVAILTATPSPTATAALATSPRELGDPDMLDTMDIPGRSWYLWGNTGVYPLTDRPGYLGLRVLKTSEITYWIRSTYPPLQDAYVQALFKTGDECHHKDRFGLVVRASERYDEGIFFVISCDGMYKIFRWNGGLKILQDWDRTTAIHTGRRQLNRVGVWMEGTTLRLFVNGVQVAEVEDDYFTEGVFGIAVGADATPGFTVYVDEVAYWLLPQPARK